MYSGKVSHYNPERGFGFIKSPDHFPDGLFFGARGLNLSSGFVPYHGDEVTFCTEIDRQGRLRAVNVVFSRHVTQAVSPTEPAPWPTSAPEPMPIEPEPEPEPWIDRPGDGRSRRRKKYQTREMHADEREFRDFRNARANLRRRAERLFTVHGTTDEAY
jgi:cold shock CspA family protein